MPLPLSNKKPLTQSIVREPFPSEIDFFRANPHVGGMAAQDNRVILNPFSNLNQQQRNSVLMNETARIIMRKGTRPEFDLTDRQKSSFKNYGSIQDQRETIIGRIISGDPSALDFTKEQSDFADSIRKQFK